MRVAIVGADFEENLGVGMIAAVTRDAGHEVRIVAFNGPETAGAVAQSVLGERPDVVGLSVQFQHRAHEFLGLARRLREGGFRGHLTCGGQFPTLAYREALEGGHGLDSVVLHEGEETFPALLAALSRGERLHEVPGLALLSDDGVAIRTAGHALPADLDAFPFPVRYRRHARHVGVPFIPIMGGRGCWGKCAYCSITSFYRDAREVGGGRTLRLRSPRNVAQEMALLWHQAGGNSIFCFHDDNLLLPRPSDTLARVREIRAHLDEYGVGKAAIIGKARPDAVTPELARELASLGVIRLYVGVENASQSGADHLRRGQQTAAVDAALRACHDAGIFVCYNLLIFEPQARVEDVRENVRFIREHADHPVNFCRAEPYFGTPMHRALESSGDLGGSYLGWNYRIADDRAELLFRVCAAAFRERNFAPDGVANRYMGLGYAASVLRMFYGDHGHAVRELSERAGHLTRSIALETADFLEEAIALVEGAAVREGAASSERDAVERGTARLGLAIAASDRRWHVAIDALRADMEAFAARAELPRTRGVAPASVLRLARNVTLGASLAVLGTTLDGCGGEVVDPAPEDGGMVVDPPPYDAGMDAGMVVDPLPDDAGVDTGMVADPPPADAGMDAGMVADPAPEDGGMAFAEPGESHKRLAVIDQWRDSSPRRAVRSADLPLHHPPDVRLVGERVGDAVVVRIVGGPAEVGTRWASEGRIEGDGREIRWTPASEDDQVRVAVRTAGGVAIVTLRARSFV